MTSDYPRAERVFSAKFALKSTVDADGATELIIIHRKDSNHKYKIQTQNTSHSSIEPNKI